MLGPTAVRNPARGRDPLINRTQDACHLIPKHAKWGSPVKPHGAMVQDVEPETRRRGSWDTGLVGHVLAVLFSVFVHVIPPAVYLFSGLFSLSNQDASWADVDHPTIIPIEFGLEMSDEKQPGGLHPAEPSEPGVTTLEDPPTVIPSRPVHDQGDAGPEASVPDAASPEAPDAMARVDAEDDAGRPDAADASPSTSDAAVDAAGARSGDAGSLLSDAGIARSELPDAASVAASSDAGVAGPGDAGGDASPDARPFRPIRDPVGLAGDARKIVPENPNVSLLIYQERVRQHPLGSRFAPTLTKLKNWQRFLNGTGLDPVQDVDRMMLAGPQLRDSSRVVAVLRYSAPQARVRAAIDVLVKRSGPRGQWVQARVPVAKAYVDGADRYFVLIAPQILVIVPTDGLEAALKLPPTIKFPSARNEAVVLFLKHPANAFREFPVKLPDTVEWMRFSMTLDPNGGADARLDAKDKDAATAAENAPKITEAVDKALVIDLLFTRQRLLDPVTFRAEGDHIRAETHITEAQLRHILSFIAAKVEQVDGPARPPAPSGSR